MFSEHNGISNRNVTKKTLNTWKLNNILLNNPWFKKETAKGKKRRK